MGTLAAGVDVAGFHRCLRFRSHYRWYGRPAGDCTCDAHANADFISAAKRDAGFDDNPNLEFIPNACAHPGPG